MLVKSVSRFAIVFLSRCSRSTWKRLVSATPDLAQLHWPEEGLEVAPDDARVVLGAALLRNAVLDPVVGELVEGAVGGCRGPAAFLHVGHPCLLGDERLHRVGVRAEALLLPLAELVGDPDPQGMTFGSFGGHGVGEWPAEGPPETRTPTPRAS